MPLQWVKPDPFLKSNGVTIYHAYSDEFSELPLEFWYTTSATAGPESDFEFDVRDLPGYGEKGDTDEVSEHRRVIRSAIKGGMLQSEIPPDTAENA